jgi:hypothetical protein
MFKLVVFLILSIQSLYAQSYNFQDLSYFEWNNQKYTVAVICPSFGAGHSGAAVNELAEHFIEQSKDFVYNEYTNRYPDLPKKFFNDMKAADKFADGRSSLIVIYNQGDLTQIQATLRFVWRNEVHPELPSEKMLGINFPTDNIRLDRYQVFGKAEEALERVTEPVALPNGAYFEDGKINFQGFVGDNWEIKNFVVNKNAPIDFVPFLFDAAEKNGISYNAPTNRIQAMVDGDMVQAQFFPSQYYLSCDKRMVPLYSRLGLELVQDEPIKGDNYLMKISRESFAKDVGEKFSARSTAQAFRSINQYKVDPLAFDISRMYLNFNDSSAKKIIQKLHNPCSQHFLSLD